VQVVTNAWRGGRRGCPTRDLPRNKSHQPALESPGDVTGACASICARQKKDAGMRTRRGGKWVRVRFSDQVCINNLTALQRLIAATNPVERRAMKIGVVSLIVSVSCNRTCSLVRCTFVGRFQSGAWLHLVHYARSCLVACSELQLCPWS
jgi:hypothetical protein